jgi:hypothetical protein
LAVGILLAVKVFNGPKEKVMNKYYILAVVNHSQKRFDFRNENSPYGRNSFPSFVAYMQRKMDRLKQGLDKEHWRHSFYRQVLEDIGNCEQAVVGVIEAKDLNEARQIEREVREPLKQAYRALGYRSYYEAP